MAGEAPIVHGASQVPGPVKISSTQLLALTLLGSTAWLLGRS